jgi:PKD repeat protein
LIAASFVRNGSPLANYRIGYGLYGAGNNWPVATVSADPTGGDVPLSVNFDSAGTTDLDGIVTAYAWDFGDGETSSETSPSHSYTAGGPYVATLTVTDNGGAQTTQEVLVQAIAPNAPPVAVASSDISSGPMPLDVIFSPAGSYDPDGFTGNIHWDFGDGGESWGGIAYHTFYEQGTWPVTLTANDGRGGTGTAPPLVITVGAPSPPAAPSAFLAIAFTADWINMTWTDNSNNEDGFKVERCPGTASFCNANPSRYAEIAQTGPNISSYGNTGLAAGTTYSYRVRAFNASGDSSYSNTSSATTPAGPTPAPGGLAASAGLRRRIAYVDLSWTDNSTDEASFVLERCQGSGCTNFGVRATLGANAVTYRDGLVARHTTYRYRVKARNASGDSGYSNIASATTP